jgi:hypothetical protein
MGQSMGIPLSLYSMGNPEDSFSVKITPEFKVILKDMLKTNNIDTSKCDILPYSSLFDLFKGREPKNFSYKYLKVEKDFNVIKKTNYEQNLKCEDEPKDKIMVFYYKDKKLNHEAMEIYYIY